MTLQELFKVVRKEHKDEKIEAAIYQIFPNRPVKIPDLVELWISYPDGHLQIAVSTGWNWDLFAKTQINDLVFKDGEWKGNVGEKYPIVVRRSI